MKAADSRIDLRSWRQFSMLAQTLHFCRAAKLLHITQSPRAQAIQQLERRLGTLLVVRTRRSVALTPVGAAMVEPVCQLLAQAEAPCATAGAAAAAAGAGAGEVGRVRLGFVSTVSFGPLPLWLCAFHQQQRSIAIELIEITARRNQALSSATRSMRDLCGTRRAGRLDGKPLQPTRRFASKACRSASSRLLSRCLRQRDGLSCIACCLSAVAHGTQRTCPAFRDQPALPVRRRAGSHTVRR